MLVSWEWLGQYVKLTTTPDDLAQRFAMVGLNHESTNEVDGDPVIDLEITSNRGDCLGHIGIAREASVLLNQPLTVPKPSIPAAKIADESMSSCFAIENRFPEGCPRYVGRIIRGVKVGPSPAWLKQRLHAIGINSVNNVVDVTNFVMFECGQPLHAFDLAKLRGNRIIIRRAEANEKFTAIDHRAYQLDAETVVIADAERAVAIGGVMGGVDSEVTDATVDLLIESAAFTPLAIRRTARKLRLHSPSSYRFERRVDPAGLQWAADRCCELIIDLAGGKCSPDSIDTLSLLNNSFGKGVGGEVPHSCAEASITLRQSKISSVLGIEIPWEQSIEILRSLGCEVSPLAANSTSGNGDNATIANDRRVAITTPSFRSDLTREIDLIEEIARVYGYDRIPENASVPTFISSKRPKDVLLDRVRAVATSAGLDEALTPSVVGKSASELMSPWLSIPALQTQVPLLEGTTYLRRTLIPSLLQAYQLNQSQQQRDAALFETATVFLPSDKPNALPGEQFTLGWVAPGDPRRMVGMLEEIIARVAGPNHVASLNPSTKDFEAPYIQNATGLWLSISGKPLAWYGALSRSFRDSLKIDAELSIGEINLDQLLTHLQLVPKLTPVIPYPVIQRDLNFVLDEAIRWQLLSETILSAGGSLVTECRYCETYRDAKKDGPGLKRVLLSLFLQSPDRTLTGEAADEVVSNVVKAAESKLSAKLLV
jgi:phenylalanyl-tRNA synthetase beta chain